MASTSNAAVFRAIAIVLVVIALVLLVIGIVYLVVPAKSISVLPGHVAGASGHHTKRGIAGVVVGGVALGAAAALAWYQRSEAR